jgi:hypothetical protein
MHVEIEQRQPGAIQIFAYDRLPNVPQWILVQLDPGANPFWTLPPDHYFEHTAGEYGFPGELQSIARRFVAGEIDQSTAEAAFTGVLEGWSRATTPQDQG